jgi:TetR/AcrR family transcriptional regulator, transcriptional repressor for nem operon
MRKPQADSLTKQKLLDAAQELMIAKGYTDTSVDEICAAAELTKGSFFHYFAGKEELGRVLAERFITMMRDNFAAAPFRSKEDPLDRVFGYIDFLVQKARSPMTKGCLLGTLVQELSQTQPAIRSVCAAGFEAQAKSLQRDLEEAKAKYVPRARWSSQSLAEHVIAVAQGAIILAKAKQDKKVMEESLEHERQYLKCLFDR